MPSRYDLGQQEQGILDELIELVKSRKGYCSQFDQVQLIELYKKFGPEVLLPTLKHSMANDWLRSSEWHLLAALFARYGTERTEWAIARMAGRKNYSIDTVSGILRNEIAAHRKPQGTEPVARKRPVERPWPPEGHLYLKHEVQRWLSEHDHPAAEVWEYFDRAGVDPNGFTILKLKGEYQ